MQGNTMANTIRRASTKCETIGYSTASVIRSLRKLTPTAFKTLRRALAKLEHLGTMGQKLRLSDREQEANKIIMAVKKEEISKGILDPSQFTPGQHIFKTLTEIRKSPIFNLIKRMPKGGVLHAHDTALCSTEYLIGLTYRKNLWICTTEEGCKAIAFRFSKEKPTQKPMEECNWEPMAEFRDRRGEENVNRYFRRRFSMYPFSKFISNNQAWAHFMGIFILLDGLLCHAPVWADYYYNALKEFSEDGVQYLELRSLLPRLYCIDGDMLTIRDTVAIYESELERFKADHPDFIDSKLIYAPLRGVEPSVVEQYVQTAVELNKEFPNFMVGFDLVGQEELGRPLKDFVEPLLKMPEHINFYFHAGETNWFGSPIDENLVDAILLGSKRIGHGFALTKHPMVMRMAKLLDIAIEVCPVSNQVLQLGVDYRNHPAALLLAANVPVVISSDDPSFWRCAPLSHDFYFAFLGIAPMKADLRFLKSLAINSIRYSALEGEEKRLGYAKWEKLWDKWIDDVVEKKGS
ncbi:adenosine deaminase 2 [Drosophila gunungcola]|uniref:adenosine deaminase 2 n=1 Tax=Drosophila gunungcola TaxID=103775 RepID=UPI0022DE9E85|nr:adenosine deaminase 2 [Drosophila gunungcola]